MRNKKVLTKTLFVCRAKDIREQIIRRMDIWERGFHTVLVGGVEAEGASKEGKATIGGEEEDKAIARSYHDILISCKLSQVVGWATNREVVGCLLPDDQCNKTARPVA